jgi:hypothetical protein
VLLSSWDINDRDPTRLPPGPHYYYLSPDSVQILNDLLEYPNARDCPKPHPDRCYYVAGDRDYFLKIQV